jgi:hypothetical protein
MPHSTHTATHFLEVESGNMATPGSGDKLPRPLRGAATTHPVIQKLFPSLFGPPLARPPGDSGRPARRLHLGTIFKEFLFITSAVCATRPPAFGELLVKNVGKVRTEKVPKEEQRSWAFLVGEPVMITRQSSQPNAQERCCCCCCCLLLAAAAAAAACCCCCCLLLLLLPPACCLLLAAVVAAASRAC